MMLFTSAKPSFGTLRIPRSQMGVTHRSPAASDVVPTVHARGGSPTSEFGKLLQRSCSEMPQC